ncbi:hypothetical protein B0H10DRAFT_2209325 [Mycena sp. CBHHK59/15]|nr:hypothetical protein B0H10DRAFT_2209325 [Mycena sp. CBHHK59/15]
MDIDAAPPDVCPDGPLKSRNDVRRSLSLFNRLPKDLSSLLRSSSLTSRRVSIHENQHRRSTTKVSLAAGYVKQDMLDNIANARASRPAKADSRVFNLISRSRSRSGSRSHGDKEAMEVDAVNVPEPPSPPSPQSPHKPVSLLQSRPLSAATTGTASTVTPANITPRKRAPAPIAIAPVEEEPPMAPAPGPKQLVARKNFHLFGITLPSPRKSSFGSSRPSTPSDVRPPSPVRRQGSPSPQRRAPPSPTPKSKLKSKPKSYQNVGQGSASKLDSLSKFFVGTGMRVPSDPQPHKTSTTASRIPTLKHSPAAQKLAPQAHITPSTIVADPMPPPEKLKQSGRKYMSEVGNTARVQDPATPTPTPRVQSSSMSTIGGSTARPRASAASVIGSTSTAHIRSISSPRASVAGSSSTPAPRASTAHASPTVVSSHPRVINSQSRPAIGVSPRMSTSTTASTSSLSTRERRPSIDSASNAYRSYRPSGRLGGIAEDRWKGKGVEEVDNEPHAHIANFSATTAVAASGRPSANGQMHHLIATSKKSSVAIATPTATATTATTATTNGMPPKTQSTIGSVSGRKHGSFDFERPGWGAGAGAGPAARGAATTLGVGFARARREPLRGASVDGRPERSMAAGMAGVGSARLLAGANRNVRMVPPPPPPPPVELEPDHTGASGSTSHSNVTGGTSSWGRSTGRRLSTGLSKLTSGLGFGSKATKSAMGAVKERQHGKFAFEPPVPTLPLGVRREKSREGERERQWEKEKEERERRVKLPLAPSVPGRGHNVNHSTSSTTSSTHTGVSVGHRSGTKGRSLDLGLGLAWAPTKVREDAVMPESSFGRSLSASRRQQQGREVADVFRNALDEDGYQSFKKYVHRFDAHEIPFDGSTGIIARVERLLRKAPHLGTEERERLLDNFVKIILQNA